MNQLIPTMPSDEQMTYIWTPLEEPSALPAENPEPESTIGPETTMTSQDMATETSELPIATSSNSEGVGIIYSILGGIGSASAPEPTTSRNGSPELPQSTADPPAPTTQLPGATADAPVPVESLNPVEIWPAPPVADPGKLQCGAFGEYTGYVGFGTMETGSGFDVADAQASISYFCNTPKALQGPLTSDSPLLWQPVKAYAGTDNVFLTQVELRIDEVCSGEELQLGNEMKDPAAYAECYRTLDEVINGCDQDSTTGLKIGGSLAKGCFVWTALSISNYNGDRDPVPIDAVHAEIDSPAETSDWK